MNSSRPPRRVVGAEPHPRLGMPTDVVSLAVFLASDEAGYITGTDFVVDGGLTAV